MNGGRSHGLRPDQVVWIVDAGFGPSMSYLFRFSHPQLPLRGNRDFGKNIAVFRLPWGRRE